MTAHAQNTDRLLCVNQEAQSAGLERGMSLSDAHALCPSLRSEAHYPQADQYFLRKKTFSESFASTQGLKHGVCMLVTGPSRRVATWG